KEPQDSLVKYLSKNENKLSKDGKEIIEEQIGNLKYDPKQIDRGFMWKGIPLFTYTPDIGPLFGAGIILYKYGFRTPPYVYRMQLTAGYAPKKKGISGLLVDYKGIFYGIIKGARTNLHLRKSGIEINNYFGYGNETNFSESLEKSGYNKVEHEEYIFNPSIEFPANSKLKFTLGSLIKYFEVKEKDSSLLQLLKPYGIEKISLLGLQAGFQVDGREHPAAPHKGYLFDVKAIYYPKVFNSQFQFGKVTADLRYYLGAKTFTDISLGLRLKGEKIQGTFPFYESAFIGGLGSVRGFPSERFAGSSSLMGSAELRIKLFKMSFLFPETVGMFLFGESGRVFVKNDDSKLWHTGYGGGLFMHVVNRDITFSLAAGKSKEQKLLFYFYTGFGF
ncbi:MAG: BamA/TamA family outer membrane protein, partial [Ignavibacteria bacterium]